MQLSNNLYNQELLSFKDTHQELSRMINEGILLQQHIKTVTPILLEIGKENHSLTTQKYLEFKEVQDISLEGIVKNIFNAVIQFFKNIIKGVYNFIKSAFGFQKKVSSANENLLKQLRPVISKYSSKLDEISASKNIPAANDFADVVKKLQIVMDQLTKVSVVQLENKVNRILENKDEEISEETNLKLDYSKIFQTDDYTAYLFKVGIEFDDERPRFKSVFTEEREEDASIKSIGYSFDVLDKLNALVSTKLEPCKVILEKNCKILEKINAELTDFSTTDSTAKGELSAPYRKIIEELPKEISKFIGLYQVSIQASIVYATKINEIIKTIYNNIATYSNPENKL